MQRCLLTHFPIAFLRLSAALQAVSDSFLSPRGLIIPQLPLAYCPLIVLFETWSDKNRKFNRNHFYSVSLSLSLSYTASASLLFVSWLACFAIPMAVMALSQLNRWSSLGHHTHWIIWYVATRNDCVSHFTHVAYVLQPQWSLWIHTSIRQVNWDKCASLVWSHLLRLLLWLVCLCDALYIIFVLLTVLFFESLIYCYTYVIYLVAWHGLFHSAHLFSYSLIERLSLRDDVQRTRRKVHKPFKQAPFRGRNKCECVCERESSYMLLLCSWWKRKRAIYVWQWTQRKAQNCSSWRIR